MTARVRNFLLFPILSFHTIHIVIFNCLLYPTSTCQHNPLHPSGTSISSIFLTICHCNTNYICRMWSGYIAYKATRLCQLTLPWQLHPSMLSVRIFTKTNIIVLELGRCIFPISLTLKYSLRNKMFSGCHYCCSNSDMVALTFIWIYCNFVWTFLPSVLWRHRIKVCCLIHIFNASMTKYWLSLYWFLQVTVVCKKVEGLKAMVSL